MRRVFAFVSVMGLLLALAPAAHAGLEATWQTDIVAASNDVAIGPGGAVYAVGQGPPGTVAQPGGGRATLTRLTTAGDIVWSRSWQPYAERPRAYLTNATAVAVGDNGVVYVVGTVRRDGCEGGGWFIRSYGPNGTFLHASAPQKAWFCRPPGPQSINDVAVRGNLVVVATVRTGCCGELAVLDGYIRGFTTSLRPLWRTAFEPPAPTDPAWYDVADSVAIGRDGSVYAAGWAAIQPSDGESQPAGSLLVEKMGHGGTLRWARRPGVPMAYNGAVSMALAGDRMMVGAAMRTGDLWLGQLSRSATPIWHRTWGGASEIRADLGGIAIDSTGRTWMVGTRRDLSDNGGNVFVRRYGATGALAGSLTIDLPAKWVKGNAVATLGGAAFVVGTRLVPAHFALLSGEVWRVQV